MLREVEILSIQRILFVLVTIEPIVTYESPLGVQYCNSLYSKFIK